MSKFYHAMDCSDESYFNFQLIFVDLPNIYVSYLFLILITLQFMISVVITEFIDVLFKFNLQCPTSLIVDDRTDCNRKSH